MTADRYTPAELPGRLKFWRNLAELTNGFAFTTLKSEDFAKMLSTLEGLREDAERYSHVRENAIAVLTEDDGLIIRIDIPADPKEIDRVNSQDACDMTIDAARREQSDA